LRGKPLSHWEHQLWSRRPVERKQALEVLKAAGAQARPATSAVRRVLRVPKLRALAIETLGAIGQPLPPACVRIVGRYRRSEDPRVRDAAMNVLEQAGVDVVKLLVKDLAVGRSPLSPFREDAIRRLGRLGPRAAPAAKALTKIVGYWPKPPGGFSSSAVRAQYASWKKAADLQRVLAMQALGAIGPAIGDRGLHAIARIIGHKTPEIGAVAVRVLANLGEDALPFLDDAFRSADEFRRYGGHVHAKMILQAFAAYGPGASAMLGDIDRFIELDTPLSELARKTETAIRSAVTRMSTRPSQDSRERLERALALLRYGEAVLPVLTDAIADPDPANRKAILTALLRGDRLRAPSVAAAMQWPPKPPLPVAGILVRALRERLSDPDADVVRLACALFAILPEKAAAPAIPRLGKLLVNRTPSIRLAAVRALRCLGARDRETLGMYVCSLAIDDAELRHAVGVALCEAGGGAIPLLVAALADDDPNAKIGAAIVLGRFGPGAASAVAALTALLEDSREAVRSAASKALERIRAE